MAGTSGRAHPRYTASSPKGHELDSPGGDEGIQALGWLIAQYERLTQIVATDLRGDPAPADTDPLGRAAALRLRLLELSQTLEDQLLAHRWYLCRAALRHGAAIEDIAHALGAPIEVVQAQLRHQIDHQRDRGELDVQQWLLLHRRIRTPRSQLQRLPPNP
jgi:hypothetical protein